LSTVNTPGVAGRERPAASELLTGIVLLVAVGLWASNDGGYAEVAWYPIAALLVALITALWIGGYPIVPADRMSLALCGSLAGYTIWSYASIGWAADRGIALTGANRTLTYLLIFAAVIQGRWAARTAAAFVVVAAALIVCVGATSFMAKAFSSHPASAFLDGRLSAPISYANANSAMFAIALWPLLVAGASRGVNPFVRALCLGLANVGLGLLLLGQSKGAVIAVAAAAVIYFICARRKLRAILPLAGVAIATLAIHRALLHPYDVLEGGLPGSASTIRSAAMAILLASGCVTVLAWAVSAVDERRDIRTPALFGRVGNRRSLVAVAIGAAVVAIAMIGNPFSLAGNAWHAFKYSPADSHATTHFVSTAGNNRYDFWRVAAKQFLAHPLTGAGAENFSQDYVRQRRSLEEPLYPHSLEAQVLGGTGVIGFMLFGAFCVLGLVACFKAARAPDRRLLAGCASAPLLVYWLAHASADWLFEFPLLTGFAFIAVASCLPVRPATPREPASSFALAAAVATVLVLGAAILIPSWLAARTIGTAIQKWRTDPAGAASDLRRAASLNRLSDQPYVVAATISERRHDWNAAAQSFDRAIDRNPHDWYAQFGEGLALAVTGSRRGALAHLRLAHNLNPREDLVSEVELTVDRHGRVDPARVDAQLIARADALVH
jgi:hypothetical protein